MPWYAPLIIGGVGRLNLNWEGEGTFTAGETCMVYGRVLFLFEFLLTLPLYYSVNKMGWLESLCLFEIFHFQEKSTPKQHGRPFIFVSWLQLYLQG